MQVGILGAWRIRVIVHESVGLQGRRGTGNATTSMGDRILGLRLAAVIVHEDVGLWRCRGVQNAVTNFVDRVWSLLIGAIVHDEFGAVPPPQLPPLTLPWPRRRCCRCRCLPESQPGLHTEAYQKAPSFV